MRSGYERFKVKLMRGALNEDYKGGQRRVTHVRRFNRHNVTSMFRAPPLNWLRVKTKDTRSRNVFGEISATCNRGFIRMQNVHVTTMTRIAKLHGTVFQNIFLRTLADAVIILCKHVSKREWPRDLWGHVWLRKRFILSVLQTRKPLSGRGRSDWQFRSASF